MAGINVFGRKSGNPQILIIGVLITLLVGIGVYMLLNTEEEGSDESNGSSGSDESNGSNGSGESNGSDSSDESNGSENENGTQTASFESSSEPDPEPDGFFSFFRSIMPKVTVGTAPSNCVLSEWEDAGECNPSSGKKPQERRVRIKSKNGGTCPAPFTTNEDDVEKREVNCPVDCVGVYKDNWGDCSKTCGGGTQTKLWEMSVSPKNGGRSCTDVYGANLHLTQACNENPCPVDCVGYHDTNWSECSTTCGDGTKTKKWNTTILAAHGGKSCAAAYPTDPDAGKTKTAPCNNGPCCDPEGRQNPQRVFYYESECVDKYHEIDMAGLYGEDYSVKACRRHLEIGEKGCEKGPDWYDIKYSYDGFCAEDIEKWKKNNQAAYCSGGGKTPTLSGGSVEDHRRGEQSVSAGNF